MKKRKHGELESEVLNCLWDRPDGLGSQQLLALMGDDAVKLTSVLTVLSRLEEKGLVERRSGSGRSLRFYATRSREQHAASQLLGQLDRKSDQGEVFRHFVSGLSAKQAAALKSALEN